MSVWQGSVCLSIRLSVRLSVCLSVHLCVRPSVRAGALQRRYNTLQAAKDSHISAMDVVSRVSMMTVNRLPLAIEILPTAVSPISSADHRQHRAEVAEAPYAKTTH